MHLEFLRLRHYGNQWIAAPNDWVVIDDFGTAHDAIDRGEFGGPFKGAHAQRRELLWLEHQDIDFARACWAASTPYTINETTAFAHPMGLSIEVDLRIWFTLHPRWDETTWTAHEAREDGARIEIESYKASHGNESSHAVVLDAAAIEEFCWAYIELEKAREEAKQECQARSATEASQ